MMFMGMAPFGALLGGAIADHFGAPRTVAIGGIASVFGAIAFWKALPSFRVEARELILAQGVAGGEPAGGNTVRLTAEVAAEQPAAVMELEKEEEELRS
jgi:hypothetical protein